MKKNKPDVLNLSQDDAISFRLFAVVAGVIVMVSLVLVGLASFFNQMRSWRVVSLYTEETHDLIADREDEFMTFYTETMDWCRKIDAESRLDQEHSISTTCGAASHQLAKMGVESLKDGSAIVYLRHSPHDDSIMIDASGVITVGRDFQGMHYAYSSQSRKRIELEKYLQGEESINRWDNFLYSIPQKEVVVPVEIDGKVVGHIFRGVIEK